jgi:hypothetical protein
MVATWQTNAMNTSDLKWINPHQPQTLLIGVYLFYFNAFFALVQFSPIILFGSVAAGLGVANEKKLGYYFAIVMAFLPLGFRLAYGTLFVPVGLISLLFEIALVVALLHPVSRNYVKLWFK